MSLLALLVGTSTALAQGPWALGVDDDGAWLDPSDDQWIGTDDAPQEDGVVGGRQVRSGRWDDAVGVVFSGAFVGCTGTLIGPKVVLTAGHCVDGYPITHVLVGSKDYLTDEGESYEVEDAVEYPNSQGTYDIAVLTLKRKVEDVEPRALAIECIKKEYLKDGADAQIVGFGATSESGGGFNSKLNEAATTIVDKNCDESVINGVAAGCNASVSPGGEIAAGGDGTDACFGDSGGPLYLKTDEGNFLVGVTSRAFIGINPAFPCRDGGIWVRPDAVLEWIEGEIGSKKLTFPVCNDAPEVSVEEILTWRDTIGTATASIVDPDGDISLATYEIVQEPEHGAVDVDQAGVITFAPDAGYVGSDTFTLSVTDGGNDQYARSGSPVSVELDVSVQVQDGKPPGSCGCASGDLAIGAWLAPLMLLAVRRR